jgi:hypothetical protein
MISPRQVNENILTPTQIAKLEKKHLDSTFISILHLLLMDLPEDHRNEFFVNFIAVIPKKSVYNKNPNKEFIYAVQQARDNVETTIKLLSQMDDTTNHIL